MKIILALASVLVSVSSFAQMTIQERYVSPSNQDIERVSAVGKCSSNNKKIILEALENEKNKDLTNCKVTQYEDHGIWIHSSPWNGTRTSRKSRAIVVCENANQASEYKYQSLVAVVSCELINKEIFQKVDLKKIKNHETLKSALKRN